MPLDLSSLRISDSASAAVAVKSYAFKPKLTASAAEGLKLVLVVAEDGKDIGKASALAKLLASEGVKDLRAAEDGLVNETLGVSRADVHRLHLTRSASPLHLSSSSGSLVLVVLSSSLASHPAVSLPDPSGSGSATLEPSALLKALEATGAKHKSLDFAERGTAPTPAASAPAVGKAEPSNSRPSKAAADARQDDAVELGITVKKSGDFSDWYTQVVVKGELCDYYTVSGCYILRPASYFVWSQIQTWFDAEIRKLGVENCYFPMFVSRRVLEREKDHIEGFAPEVAWVTKAGDTELEEHIAIRPTSETVMYPYYAKWIRSHRDLPLRLNQWNSVVRWEFKTPQPFMRTREFLWQEGHTAHLRKEGADAEVLQILDLYRRVYEDLLAVPVIPGVKSEKEKFAGGLYTTTVEGFIATSGRGIQGGTSHCLGQNFSKMFNIVVEDPDKPATADGGEAGKLHVWQNSWGLSTRTIGVMTMVHGDDRGLVLPPRVAQTQVIVIPTGLTVKTTAEQRQTIHDEAERIRQLLVDAGIRAKADTRSNYTPGFKFADWELRGVPVRLEVGPKDLAAKSTLGVRRDTGAKAPIPLDALAKDVAQLLETVQADMFAKAKREYEERIRVVREWPEFTRALNSGCVCVIPWCEVEACEDHIKAQSAKESAEQVVDERAPSAGAKSLCMPFDQDRFGPLGADAKCTGCGKPAKRWTMFGRSY